MTRVTLRYYRVIIFDRLDLANSRTSVTMEHIRLPVTVGDVGSGIMVSIQPSEVVDLRNILLKLDDIRVGVRGTIEPDNRFVLKVGYAESDGQKSHRHNGKDHKHGGLVAVQRKRAGAGSKRAL